MTRLMQRLRSFPALRSNAPSQVSLPGIEPDPAELPERSLNVPGGFFQLRYAVAHNSSGAYVRGSAELDGGTHHGCARLAAALQLRGEEAVLMSGDPTLADFRPERALYFDLETTGLPYGGCSQELPSWQRRRPRATATTPLAFLIGAATINSSGTVHLNQFLLRQQPDEGAQLQAFAALLEGVDYLVSFNGRSFDRNILADRMVRNRMNPDRILSLPHLDLLHPSARLYRDALGGARLSLLEGAVLGVTRSDTEVSGAEVPECWLRYLGTGDPCMLAPVLEHNAADLLSLLTLSAHLARCLKAPTLCLTERSMVFAAARMLLQRGQALRGEQLLRRLTGGGADEGLVYRSLELLAEHLRRSGRHQQALPLWRRMMESGGLDDPKPWRAAIIALERRLSRPQEALVLVDEFLRRMDEIPSQVDVAQLEAEFLARRKRLDRRLSRVATHHQRGTAA